MGIKRIGGLLMAGALLVSACTSSFGSSTPSPQPAPAPAQTEAAPPAYGPAPPAPTPAEGENAPAESPPALRAGPTSLPDIDFSRFRQLLAQDAIRPIYNATFLSAAESSYRDDELILGLEINGEAKAYSVGFLSYREMVNDELGGVPILVTW